MSQHKQIFEITESSIRSNLLNLAILVEDSTIVWKCGGGERFDTKKYSIQACTKKIGVYELYELFPKGGVAAHHLVGRANKLNGINLPPDTVHLSVELIDDVLYVVTPELDTFYLGGIDDVDSACDKLKPYIAALQTALKPEVL